MRVVILEVPDGNLNSLLPCRRLQNYALTEQGIASERRDHADLRAASRDAGNPRGVAPKNRRAGEALRREIFRLFSQLLGSCWTHQCRRKNRSDFMQN